MFNIKSKPHFWINLFPFFLASLLTLIILGLLQFLPSKLPLFYSLPWGDKQLGTHQQFLIIPAVISLITLLNLTISWQLHSSQIFFKKVLLFASIIISLIFTISLIKIVVIFL